MVPLPAVMSARRLHRHWQGASTGAGAGAAGAEAEKAANSPGRGDGSEEEPGWESEASFAALECEEEEADR